jgi:hypothetical protein
MLACRKRPTEACDEVLNKWSGFPESDATSEFLSSLTPDLQRQAKKQCKGL